MKITLVGDIFPADEFLSVGFGIRSQFEATKGERWKDNIQGIMQDSDIVIGNLESPLLEPSLAAGKPESQPGVCNYPVQKVSSFGLSLQF